MFEFEELDFGMDVFPVFDGKAPDFHYEPWHYNRLSGGGFTGAPGTPLIATIWGTGYSQGIGRYWGHRVMYLWDRKSDTWTQMGQKDPYDQGDYAKSLLWLPCEMLPNYEYDRPPSEEY